MPTLSERAARFLDALWTLWHEHSVILAISGSDALQVWDARAGEAALERHGVEGCTGITLAPRDEQDR